MFFPGGEEKSRAEELKKSRRRAAGRGRPIVRSEWLIVTTES